MQSPTFTKPLSPLTPCQSRRLRRVERFLTNILDPKLGRVAVGHGYNTQEHQMGWDLLILAMGSQRPWEHALSEIERLQHEEENPKLHTLYLKIDAFEKRWFPRMHAILARLVAPTHREAVIQAFFKDLTQQAPGTASVRSVTIFLMRIQSLKSSQTPGIPQAMEAIDKRGLDDDALTKIYTLLQHFQKVKPPTLKMSIPAEAIQATAQQQLEAYEDLKLWFNDWAETLRPEFTRPQRLRLGLTKVR